MSISEKLYIIPKEVNMPQNSNGLALIIMKYEDEKVIQNSLEMLQKLIEGGLNLKFSETLVMQITEKEKFKLPNSINKVFLFGVQPQQIGLNVNSLRNKTMRINHQSIVCTDETALMINDGAKKKAFWTEISKIFKV